MEIIYLTPQEALHALAEGQILVNDDGANVLLDDGRMVLRYTMGKHHKLVNQDYNDAFDKLFVPTEATEEETGGT